MDKVLIIIILSGAFLRIHSETFDEDNNKVESDGGEQSGEEHNNIEDGSGDYNDQYNVDTSLENYLDGYTASKISENRCPLVCEKEGEIYENPQLSSYCKCEQTEGSLKVIQHNCTKNQIYNATIKDCHELTGNGFVTCVINDHQCPSNETGIKKHPNENLYKNYIICLKDKIIVAECDVNSYYNENEKQCKPQTNKGTTLIYSECEEVPNIDCKEPGVNFVVEYYQQNNKSVIIPEPCTNCYYLCNDKDLDSFELTIQCFPEATTIPTTIGYESTTLQFTDYSNISLLTGKSTDQVISTSTIRLFTKDVDTFEKTTESNIDEVKISDITSTTEISNVVIDSRILSFTENITLEETETKATSERNELEITSSMLFDEISTVLTTEVKVNEVEISTPSKFPDLITTSAKPLDLETKSEESTYNDMSTIQTSIIIDPKVLISTENTTVEQNETKVTSERNELEATSSRSLKEMSTMLPVKVKVDEVEIDEVEVDEVETSTPSRIIELETTSTKPLNLETIFEELTYHDLSTIQTSIAIYPKILSTTEKTTLEENETETYVTSDRNELEITSSSLSVETSTPIPIKVAVHEIETGTPSMILELASTSSKPLNLETKSEETTYHDLSTIQTSDEIEPKISSTGNITVEENETETKVTSEKNELDISSTRLSTPINLEVDEVKTSTLSMTIGQATTLSELLDLENKSEELTYFSPSTNQTTIVTDIKILSSTENTTVEENETNETKVTSERNELEITSNSLFHVTSTPLPVKIEVNEVETSSSTSNIIELATTSTKPLNLENKSEELSTIQTSNIIDPKILTSTENTTVEENETKITSERNELEATSSRSLEGISTPLPVNFEVEISTPSRIIEPGTTSTTPSNQETKSEELTYHDVSTTIQTSIAIYSKILFTTEKTTMEEDESETYVTSERSKLEITSSSLSEATSTPLPIKIEVDEVETGTPSMIFELATTSSKPLNLETKSEEITCHDLSTIQTSDVIEPKISSTENITVEENESETKATSEKNDLDLTSTRLLEEATTSLFVKLEVDEVKTSTPPMNIEQATTSSELLNLETKSVELTYSTSSTIQTTIVSDPKMLSSTENTTVEENETETKITSERNELEITSSRLFGVTSTPLPVKVEVNEVETSSGTVNIIALATTSMKPLNLENKLEELSTIQTPNIIDPKILTSTENTTVEGIDTKVASEGNELEVTSSGSLEDISTSLSLKFEVGTSSSTSNIIELVTTSTKPLNLETKAQELSTIQTSNIIDPKVLTSTEHTTVGENETKVTSERSELEVTSSRTLEEISTPLPVKVEVDEVEVDEVEVDEVEVDEVETSTSSRIIELETTSTKPLNLETKSEELTYTDLSTIQTSVVIDPKIPSTENITAEENETEAKGTSEKNELDTTSSRLSTPVKLEVDEVKTSTSSMSIEQATTLSELLDLGNKSEELTYFIPSTIQTTTITNPKILSSTENTTVAENETETKVTSERNELEITSNRLLDVTSTPLPIKVVDEVETGTPSMIIELATSSSKPLNLETESEELSTIETPNIIDPKILTYTENTTVKENETKITSEKNEFYVTSTRSLEDISTPLSVKLEVETSNSTSNIIELITTSTKLLNLETKLEESSTTQTSNIIDPKILTSTENTTVEENKTKVTSERNELETTSSRPLEETSIPLPTKVEVNEVETGTPSMIIEIATTSSKPLNLETRSEEITYHDLSTIQTSDVIDTKIPSTENITDEENESELDITSSRLSTPVKLEVDAVKTSTSSMTIEQATTSSELLDLESKSETLTYSSSSTIQIITVTDLKLLYSTENTTVEENETETKVTSERNELEITSNRLLDVTSTPLPVKVEVNEVEASNSTSNITELATASTKPLNLETKSSTENIIVEKNETKVASEGNKLEVTSSGSLEEISTALSVKLAVDEVTTSTSSIPIEQATISSKLLNRETKSQELTYSSLPTTQSTTVTDPKILTSTENTTVEENDTETKVTSERNELEITSNRLLDVTLTPLPVKLEVAEIKTSTPSITIEQATTSFKLRDLETKSEELTYSRSSTIIQTTSATDLKILSSTENTTVDENEIETKVTSESNELEIPLSNLFGETSTPLPTNYITDSSTQDTLTEETFSRLNAKVNVNKATSQLVELTTLPIQPLTSESPGSKEQTSSDHTMCHSRKDQKCDKEGFFRYNQSCILHYECFYNAQCKSIIPSDVYECPGCLKFNAKLMRCDFAENVPECTYKMIDSPKGRKCTGPGRFPVPNDRSRYYECMDKFSNNDYLLKVKVCLHNKWFNINTGRCKKYRCGKTNREQFQEEQRKCGKNHYLYDKYDCRKFFHCQHGKPKISLSCPREYVFNENYCQSQNNTSFCNWEELKKHLYKHKK